MGESRFASFSAHAVCVLLLICHTAKADDEVKALCMDSTILPCKADVDLNMNYTSVSWYKVDENGMTAIVHRNIKRNTIYYSPVYENSSRIICDDTNSLEKDNLSEEDNGFYVCFLWSAEQSKRRQGRITLTVTGCPVTKDENSGTAMILAETLGPAVLLLLSFLGLYFNYRYLRVQDMFLKTSKYKLKSHLLPLFATRDNYKPVLLTEESVIV
ncbi:uncharacterized protein LOC122796603 isoform X2 [Protopterus annectens]|uniref:uncharacterized protein LOC122796603 isoform X2 n=1 Tax=Protopterus annectens TaxID=7888 RepID=UPI001CFAF3B6|nr:uncharacterized protein LOC122796603 isoform X2 [Protopterus annectens]